MFKPLKVKSFFEKNKSTLLFAILIFAMRWSFADQYRVPTGSMEPTIHVGDHIGVNKMAYDLKVPYTNWRLIQFDNPQRGDIVVFQSPEDSSLTLVKRLIGLPGDRIVVENGFITLNGKPVKIIGHKGDLAYFEIWQDHRVLIRRDYRRSDRQEFVVPENMYFFMGDNRDNSYDSRAWGFVPRENLKGKAERVLWNIQLKQGLPYSEIARIGEDL